MIQDGCGYGKSSFWEYNARNILKDQNQACAHFNNLIVSIIHDVNLPHNLKLEITCPFCKKDFSKTQEVLTKKFLEFYGK